MENSFDYITENYNRIYNEIEAAKAKYRKPSDHVDFMAVTKTVAPEAVNHAIHCGISLLGENRVQEYLSKRDFMTRPQRCTLLDTCRPIKSNTSLKTWH